MNSDDLKQNEDKPFEGSQKDGKSRKKSKRSKGFQIFFIILALLTVLTLVFTSGGIIYVKKNFKFKYNDIPSEPEELGFEEVKDDKIVNIALFGVDSRSPTSFKGRSDSIMILSINTTTNKIKLISVLRDSLVPIDKPDYSEYNKINAAYASGGPQLAVKTLNKIFSLDISEYAAVNFFGMADIIDAIGGIEVEVTSAEVAKINAGVTEQCLFTKEDPAQFYISGPGKQILNGIQAVSYSRIRYTSNAMGTSNDYGRTDRQRLVLGQLFKQVASQSKTKYISLIKAISPYCETSLKYSEILSLAMDVLLDSPTFEESRVPFEQYIMKAPSTNHGSVIYYDLNFAANIIHAFIYEDVTPNDFIAMYGTEQNDWYSSGYRDPVIVSHEDRQKKTQPSD